MNKPLLALIILAWTAASSWAATQCVDGLTAVKVALAEMPRDTFFYALADNGDSRYYLLIEKQDARTEPHEEISRRWKLLEREGEELWCEIGSGSQWKS